MSILSVLGELKSWKIVLASASPRRQELLRRMGVTFDVVVSDFAEDLDKKAFLDNPAGYPLATAKAKGMDVYRKLSNAPPQLIISADTIVLPDGGTSVDILEKAESPKECIKMMSQLQGKRHCVVTGVVLLLPATGPCSSGACRCVEFTETTFVYLEPLDETALNLYAAQPDAWRGKAGAYGIQDLAATFISRIEGDYYNVMGFPVCAISKAISTVVKEQGRLP